MQSENAGIYTVKTGNFEGPFNLLLYLIEEKKLHISDLSLAEVTENYLKYIKQLGNLNEEETSNFIVVAATLILLKSKSLLPNIALTEEEEKDIKNLEDRLKLFEFYSKLSIEIKNIFGKKIIWSAREKKHTEVVFLPDNQITKEHMMSSIEEVIGRIPKKVFLPEVEIKKVISLEEVIDRLTVKIRESAQINFHEFAGGAKNKEEKVMVIVSFLAMLELVRQGILDAMQSENFQDITINKIEKDNE